MDRRVVIVGGGPAGLTAAWALAKSGVACVVLEKDALWGGHARTVEHRGYLFDVGGHRFFTKIPEVLRIWQEVMDDGFLSVPRLSRILYKGRFFAYPLKPLQALRQMGLLESAWVAGSYLRKKISPLRPEATLEAWMSNRFGRRLFLMFFKSYTEKVWGIPCTEVRAEWAAQRIKTLTLWGALRTALWPGKDRPRSLIEVFDYPEKGPGMLWTRMARRLLEWKQELHLGSEVVSVRWSGHRVSSVTTRRARAPEEEHLGSDFIVSMPLQELVLALDPPAPKDVQAHARALKYRDFIMVALVIRKAKVFPDNWIYIHTPEVFVGRIQNFKNWSALMVPDPETTCLGLEYFCTEGDHLWSQPDSEILALARRETVTLGFALDPDIAEGTVVRQKKAYPVYDAEYRGHLEALKAFLSGYSNLQMVGRNGLHKYNNQDHAMLTSLLAAKNVLGEKHDVWAVNTEEEYHEADPAAE